MDFEDFNDSKDSPYDAYLQKARMQHRVILDIITPLAIQRWIGVYVLIALFLLRIIYAEGWYIICYTWAIFLLNMFLKFLTPKFDPSLEQEFEDQSIEEGTSKMDENDEEFKPFIRRLPEFKFWEKTFYSTLVALVCSFIPFLDIPVFWPILVMYFIFLFILTMRKQIQHMMKFHYLPFDLGKTKYTGK